MLPYSPIKNNAKPIAEYSVLKPETNSPSASGKSKGCLLHSANKAIKVITNKGNNGITNQIYFCAKTILVKFKEPVHKKITAKTEPIDNS